MVGKSGRKLKSLEILAAGLLVVEFRSFQDLGNQDGLANAFRITKQTQSLAWNGNTYAGQDSPDILANAL